MTLSHDEIKAALTDLQIEAKTDGEIFFYSTPGRHAPDITAVITLDEAKTGATILATLPNKLSPELYLKAYELFNLVHGQDLWNFRFHLDDEGHLVTSGRVELWGQPFNKEQFNEVFFTVLVSTDRIFPCIESLIAGKPAEEAFENFFKKPEGKQPSA